MRSLEAALAQPRLPALDGIRAIAVGVVILYHAGLAAFPGDLGVTAFFVLSGFLITWLLLKERGRTGSIDIRGFFLRRSLRIFPAYLAVVVFSVAADSLLGDPWTLGRTVSAFTYTLNYHNAFFGHEGSLAHAWSLAVEEQFYLIWPALFLWLASRGYLRTGLIALIGGVVAWRSVLLLNGAPSSYLYNAFETRFDALAIGCLLAVLCTSPEFVRASRHVVARPWYPVVAVVALVWTRSSLGDHHYTIGMTLEALLLALLIVQLLQASAHWSYRWIDHRATRWLGALSYPLYLWHIWGLDVGRNAPGGPVVQLAAGLAITLGLAAGSYYGLERYFLTLKDRMGRTDAAAPGYGTASGVALHPREAAGVGARASREGGDR